MYRVPDCRKVFHPFSCLLFVKTSWPSLEPHKMDLIRTEASHRMLTAQIQRDASEEPRSISASASCIFTGWGQKLQIVRKWQHCNNPGNFAQLWILSKALNPTFPLEQGVNSCADLIVAAPGIEPPTLRVQVKLLNHYAQAPTHPHTHTHAYTHTRTHTHAPNVSSQLETHMLLCCCCGGPWENSSGLVSKAGVAFGSLFTCSD